MFLAISGNALINSDKNLLNRIIKNATIGKKITDITPTRGFAAEFGAATTILIFSMPFLAVPVSTTHTLVGAVVGVGLAGGAKAVDFRVFGKIAASWVASVPVAAFGAATIYIASGGDDLKMIIGPWSEGAARERDLYGCDL